MRILLIQLADIGDLILTTPAIAALREAQPGAHLTLLTTAHAAPVLDAGLVDAVIALKKQGTLSFFFPGNLRHVLRGRYDVALFFHHFTLKAGTPKFAIIAARARRRIGLQNGNGWFLTESLPDEGFGARHQAQYWLDLVGLLGAVATPRPAQVKTTPYPDAPPAPYVVIHPGSGGYSRARRWDAEKFAIVADALQTEHHKRVVLVGGADDNTAAVAAAMHTTPLDLTGQTTLSQLTGLIAGAEAFIGADSGVLHLAAATGTRVIAIYGPSNHQAWGPWSGAAFPASGQITIIRSAPQCSPCSYVGHGIGLREGCPARTCMRMVTADDVLRHFQQPPPPPQPEATTSPAPAFPRRVRILGLPVDAITYAEWLDLIDEWVSGGAGMRHVCTINPEFVMIAQRDPNFHNILQRAALCVPDGVGLLWAARRAGVRLPERVTGSDGVPIIAERAAARGWKLFFLGAAPGVADAAAEVLRARHPGLQVVGIYAGSPAPAEEDAIVTRINASGADILFVAYGAPVQDKWIARNSPRLQVGMAMGVGGAFDFIAGVIPRAPLWMRRAGLEWLFRLYLQPSRFGRMLRLPRFVVAVLLRGRK